MFLSLCFFLPLFATACSKNEIDEQKARYMLENAVFSPEQMFDKYKTFYMRTERIVIESAAADMYVNALDQESYNLNALFENKVVQELYIQDDKIRLSCYVESLTMPLELHIIYDGENMQAVSNFTKKDSRKITLQQAKDFISYPGSDFFRRVRADFEQSGKEIQYKYAGTQKYNGYKCNIIEMSLKDDDDEQKAVFYIDQKTNIMVKSIWAGILPNSSEVKKISKISGEKVPVIIEMFYGQYFTAIVKYSVKVNEYIHPDIFNEANILLPMRNMYNEQRFLAESVDRRRTRIRSVLDSVQSFDFVLNNMHLSSVGEGFPGFREDDVEGTELPELANRLVPDNTASFRIPIASAEQDETEKKKKVSARPAPSPKPQPQPKPATPPKSDPQPQPKPKQWSAPADENDETDWLEYSPRDAYKAIEDELEEMKEMDPEEYKKMKIILEEMKQKDTNLQNLSN